MKKPSRSRRPVDRDTMQPEYDFSNGVRGATAERYAEGRNVIVINPIARDRRKRPPA